jgi:hypothetical protein
MAMAMILWLELSLQGGVDNDALEDGREKGRMDHYFYATTNHCNNQLFGKRNYHNCIFSIAGRRERCYYSSREIEAAIQP